MVTVSPPQEVDTMQALEARFQKWAEDLEHRVVALLEQAGRHPGGRAERRAASAPPGLELGRPAVSDRTGIGSGRWRWGEALAGQLIPFKG